MSYFFCPLPMKSDTKLSAIEIKEDGQLVSLLLLFEFSLSRQTETNNRGASVLVPPIEYPVDTVYARRIQGLRRGGFGCELKNPISLATLDARDISRDKYATRLQYPFVSRISRGKSTVEKKNAISRAGDYLYVTMWQ